MDERKTQRVSLMGKKKQVTIYTDFDKALVETNTPFPIVFLLFLSSPKTVLMEVYHSIREYGLGGRGFADVVYHEKLNPQKRIKILKKVASKLELNPRWIGKLLDYLHQNPEIDKVKLVIISRNVYFLPEYFMKKQGKKLAYLISHKFTGDVTIIANGKETIEVRHSTNLNYHPKHYHLGLHQVINKSKDKKRFITEKNALFFGDAEDCTALKKAGLKHVQFVKV